MGGFQVAYSNTGDSIFQVSLGLDITAPELELRDSAFLIELGPDIRPAIGPGTFGETLGYTDGLDWLKYSIENFELSCGQEKERWITVREVSKKGDLVNCQVGDEG